MAKTTVSSTGVVIVGDRPKPTQDLYHLWLRTTWPRAILLIAVVYLAVNALFALMATPGDNGQGQFNGGAYSNSKVDELIRKIGGENDMGRRNALIAEAFKIHQDDIGHIPLHQQPITWGLKKTVDMVQLPDNFNYLRWVTVK